MFPPWMIFTGHGYRRQTSRAEIARMKIPEITPWGARTFARVDLDGHVLRIGPIV